MTLEELAIKYASDRYYKHSYIPFYAKLMEQLRPERVLEIGIGYPDLMQRQLPAGVDYIVGSGLFMWSERFPLAEIIGVDIRSDVQIHSGNIKSIIADQSLPSHMWAVAQQGPFDLIIDDGSHLLDHQYVSAAVLLPYLRRGGIYIIEDILPHTAKTLTSMLGLGEIVSFGKCWDDRIVLIRK